MISIITKLLLFFLSEAGYFISLERKTKINRSFVPMVVLSIQVCAVFLGGILNLLKPVVYFLYLLGFCLLLRMIFREKRIIFFQEYLLDINYIFLFVMICLCILALHGRRFGHYDNFSHWALIVKQMLLTDRLPNFLDKIISFQDYPPASACFIYYFCSFVSEKEWIQMLAQAFLDLAFVTAVFGFARIPKKILALFYGVLFGNFILSWNTPLDCLLVDNLLGLSGAGLLIYLYYYSRETENADNLCLLLSIPISGFCMLVKNSGLFYCAIGSVWLIYFGIKSGLRRHLITAISPYLAFIIWKGHVGYVFQNAGATKHALNLASYIKTYTKKDMDLINDLVRSFLKFSVSGRSLLIAFLCVFFTGIIIFFYYPCLRKKYQKFMMLSICFYIVYQIGMLLMYIFSMPEKEASVLASADRYRNTYFITIYSIISAFGISALSNGTQNAGEHNLKKTLKTIVPALALVFIMTGTWRYQSEQLVTFFTPDTNIYRRISFEKILSDYDVKKDKSYLLLIDSGHNGYEYFLMKYLYYTNSLAHIRNIKASGLPGANKYDYVINYDDKNPNVINWIRSNYPLQTGKTVIRTLHGINDINVYLDSIDNPEYMVFISVNNDAFKNLNDTTKEKLRKLGLDQDWSSPDIGRNGYAAVLYKGIAREISEERAEINDQINDSVWYEVISAVDNKTGNSVSSIRINDAEYSKNRRGFNIVVYDPIGHNALDSVNFDTFSEENAAFR